jgi:hypothetical protein
MSDKRKYSAAIIFSALALAIILVALLASRATDDSQPTDSDYDSPDGGSEEPLAVQDLTLREGGEFNFSSATSDAIAIKMLVHEGQSAELVAEDQEGKPLFGIQELPENIDPTHILAFDNGTHLSFIWDDSVLGAVHLFVWDLTENVLYESHGPVVASRLKTGNRPYVGGGSGRLLIQPNGINILKMGELREAFKDSVPTSRVRPDELEWAEYQSEEWKVSINYPSEWEMTAKLDTDATMSYTPEVITLNPPEYVSFYYGSGHSDIALNEVSITITWKPSELSIPELYDRHNDTSRAWFVAFDYDVQSVDGRELYVIEDVNADMEEPYWMAYYASKQYVLDCGDRLVNLSYNHHRDINDDAVDRIARSIRCE